MDIAIIGTGYVGLVTGTCFAETGNDVICVDIDEAKVASLKEGVIPIYEPGLDTLFERNVREQRLTFTTDLAEAVRKAQIIFLALPTPPDEDGSADLSYVMGVADQIAPMLEEYKVIVNKSTVPVGTAAKVREIVAAKSKVPFDVVSNPEFLREGVAVDDFMRPDRVVIGTSSDQARQVMNDLYRPFVRQGNPVIFMDEPSAELTKYAANSFLAAKISFMNEVANLCELVGADIDQVRRGIGTDNRIGKRFLFAGVGYGGSCFPKDVRALHRTSQHNDYDFKILDAVVRVNELQRARFFEKMEGRFAEGLKGKTVAIWGLSFKPNTDDIREAPAIYLIERLLSAGARVQAYDPEAIANAKRIFQDRVSFSADQYEALRGADMLAIVTEWSAFRTPHFDKMRELMGRKIIYDGRNVYDLPSMAELGFEYHSIGRKDIEG